MWNDINSLSHTKWNIVSIILYFPQNTEEKNSMETTKWRLEKY